MEPVRGSSRESTSSVSDFRLHWTFEMNLASFETTDKKLKKEQTLEGNSWEWVIRAIQMWTWREVIGKGVFGKG